MEPRLRASPEQFSILIDFMERHGDLSRPQSGPQGRVKGDRLWMELTNILNSLGGGVQKSSDKWKKVWADWKTKTKKKYLNLRLQASGTGGGPSSRISLTALEERVVAVIGVSAVVGQAGIQEQGFNRTPSEPVLESGSAIGLPLEHENALDVALEDHSQNIAADTPASPAIRSVRTLPQPQHIIPHVIVATPGSATPASPPSPPPPQPPTSPPRTPTARSYRRQASTSPRSTATSPRRALLRARRNRGLTPFERAADLFATVEQRRLVHEEARDKRLHEREMERLRLEAERIEVAREHNSLLHQLSHLGERLIDVITQQRLYSSLPSTDPI